MNHRLCMLVAGFAGCLLPAGTAVSQVRLGPQGPEFVQPKPKQEPGKKAKPVRMEPNPDEPKLYKLTVSPAAEPDLPLTYSLIPPHDKLKEGNSVPFYYRAVLAEQNLKSLTSKQEFWEEKYDPWLDADLTDLPKDEVRKFLNSYEGVFRETQTAAFRKQTDWSWRLDDKEGISAIYFFLEEIQQSRQLARLLKLKIRLELAEGRYADAVETMQVGNKLARDVTAPPILICDLVGVAIATIINEEVIHLIGAPDSPNLYWALTQMQQPFIDVRPSLQYELKLPGKLFPALENAETAEHSPQEWRRMLGEAFTKLQTVQRGSDSGDSQQKLQSQLAVTGLVLRGYPRARRDLIEWGYSRERVDKMPVGQVVAVHQARLYRYISQEFMKWSYIPFHEGRSRIKETEEKLKREGYLGPTMQSREIIPVAGLLTPAVSLAFEASMRLDSRLAVLRAVEAIRMHAAENDGKLPATLDEITVVPVPNNPRDNKPFPYRFDGTTATIELPAAPGQPANIGWRFAITVRK